MDKKTAIAMLKLDKDYNDGDIKRQYRLMSKIFHPDSKTGSQELFKLLTESKDFLLDYKEESKGTLADFKKTNEKYDSLRYRANGTLLNIVDLWK